MNKYFTVVILLLFGGNCLWGQAGTVDSTFGENGVLYFEPAFPFPPYEVITARDPSNRIIAVQSSEADSNLLIRRFLEAGVLDPDFGQNGEVLFPGGLPLNIWSLAVQNDHKIVVAGEIHDPVDTLWYTSNIFIARFLENGQSDPLFGFQGAVTIDLDTSAAGWDVAVQIDGKILVTGWLGRIGGGGNSDVFLLRLLSDGAPDSSFGTAGMVVTDLNTNNFDNDIGFKIALQPDGKILVSGRNGTWYNGVGDLALIRYLPNGLLDASFGNNGIVISKADIPEYRKILLNSDQSILVAGNEGSVFGGGFYVMLRKFNTNGGVDSSFADNGVFKSEPSDFGRAFYDLELQSDNKIVAAGVWGEVDSGYYLMMRFLPDGRPDSTFGINARGRLYLEDCGGSFRDFWFSPDKKITVLGVCSDYWTDSIHRVYLARFNNDFSNSVHNPVGTPDLAVFPNPASERIFFLFKDRVSGVLNFSRQDGTVISTATLRDEQQCEIPAAGLPSGVYHWRWVTEQSRQMTAGKILVLH